MKLSRLARRMLTADIWAPSLLALFVAVVSGLVTLAPRNPNRCAACSGRPRYWPIWGVSPFSSRRAPSSTRSASP